MSPLLLAFLQTPGTEPATIDLRQPPAVVETKRLRLTPNLDGQISEEEWDEFGVSGGVKTYLQWEPGMVHVAAAMASGKDLLLSLDLAGDGWLVGNDNLEVRIGVRDGKSFVKLRILDATAVVGPTYREISNAEAASRVMVGADGTIEATIGDPGLGLLPKESAKLAARLDAIPTELADPASNEPRTLAPLLFGDVRDAGLPASLKVKVDFNDIATIPGETATIRYSFTGEPMPRRIALRSEGAAREATSTIEMPFPSADKKGVSVEYKTTIAPSASEGYRIARATMTDADGLASVVQASYRIAPLVDVVMNDPHLKKSDQDRSLKIGFTVFGNSRGRLSGQAMVSVPGGYRILNGDESQKIRLFEPRRGLPKGFGLFVPANSSGTVPIRFALEIGGKKFDVVRYLTID